MSRATVRAALYAFLAPPNVSGINTLSTSTPKRIPGSDFRKGQIAGTKSGAVGVLHLDGENEMRIALGGATSGRKEITYSVTLEVYQHSIQTHAETAMDDFDAVIETVKARIRLDRQVGTAGVIFRAGETQLDGVYGRPKTLSDGATEIWGAVAFEAVEIITS